MTAEPTAGARVLDVPLDWTLPRLGRKVLPPGGRVVTEDDSVRLVHHDTAEAHLAGLGADLTREEGSGTWTLTVAGTTSTFPGTTARAVPAAVRELLLGFRAGAALRAGARESRTRLVHRVLDADGVELGTITDVRTALAASRTAGAEAGETRHVEVAGWGTFPDLAVARLVRHEALERTASGPGNPTTVGESLTRFLAEQRTAALHADLGLRRGEDEVHAFRVAVRRIRSALRVVDVWDAGRAADLDAELRWLSGELGAVRDLEVLAEHLRATMSAVRERSADAGLLAAADEAVTATLAADREAAEQDLARVMKSRRYIALLREIGAWSVQPPFTEAADEPVAELARYVRKAARDLDRKLAKAGTSADRLHRARKAAKRARYVAAAAGASAGKHGPKVEKRAKALQTALGDHQDHVLASDHLAALRSRVGADAAFGIGVFWAYEQERADAALATATGG
ncbi:CHAD domain-containing protein [Jatrophihabitans fulvus]